MSQPMFSIRDNGDGTATVYDGGIAIATIERQRGTYERGREHSADYVRLQYVARGHSLRAKAQTRSHISGPEFSVSVASSSADVAENVNPDTVAEAMDAARAVYVAGRVADLAEWHRRGKFGRDEQADLAEWIPKYRASGEADLADAFAEFLGSIEGATR